MTWYDKIRYDMMWCDMIYYMMWYDVIYDMMWCDMIWYMIRCDMLWYDIRYDVIWCGMIWYDDIIYLLLQLGWQPVAVVQYTFTPKEYIEQHNESEYTEQNMRNNKNK
jgi:hypothetical protein